MALVAHIEGNCPSCGAKHKFGIVDVRGSFVLKGCEGCQYKERQRLPPLKKKVVYLDQFFLSHAFRGNDDRFSAAAVRLEKIAQYQLLVAPYSTLHEDETDLWKRREELLGFIQKVSRGHEFVADYKLDETQIFKAFQAWTNGEESKYILEENDVFEDEIHTWEGYFRINVDRYRKDRELSRSLKSQSVSSLIDMFDDWRESQSTFEEDVLLELNDAAKGYLTTYFSYASRMSQGDFSAVLNAPVMSIVVQNLLRSIPRNISEEKRLQTILAFFSSDHFRSVPGEELSARIFASLKKMVKTGAYKNKKKAKEKLSGFFYDVRHVAKYGPYCDAFFADKAMAELLSAPEIDFSRRYGVQVFTVDTIDEFYVWLDQLEENMSDEHKAGLKQAYPFIEVQ
ncbi:hypothetical protein [Thalassospira lucentensis]|uniref:hypothetical protein n=1 Tax=Thalassospira lucentensis TaxID=168935 RepID=UPI003D28251F